MTLRPMAVEPVNSRWLNGSRVNCAATSGPPVTTVTSSGAKPRATSRWNSAENDGVYSDIFTIARLPATRAATSGPIARYRG